MKEKHPRAEIETTDVARMLPREQHHQFQIADANEEWPYTDGSFDLIHMRGLDGAIKDWPATITKAQRCLKPGGSLELGFITFPRSEADEQLLLPSLLMYYCAKDRKRPFGGDRWEDLMQEAGFTDVRETRKRVRLSNSGQDKAEYPTDKMILKMDGVRIIGLSDMGCDADYTQEQLRSMKKEVEKAVHHGAFIEV